MSADPVELLREVPLPEDPFDRYSGVVARRRKGDRRRYTVLSASLATVLVAAGISALALRSPETKDLSSVLSSTPSTAHVVGTGKFDAGETGSKNGEFQISGDIDFARHATDFTISLKVGGSPTSAGQRIVQIGRDRWTFEPGVLGQPAQWLHDASGSSGDFEQLDPETLFRTLQEDRASVRELGTEDIDGVRTTHYEVAQQKGVAGSPFAEGAGQVFVDEQGRVRRLSLIQSDGTFTFTFSRFGEALDIAPPPAAQVKEASDLIPKNENCTTTPSTSGSSAYTSSCTIVGGTGSATQCSSTRTTPETSPPSGFGVHTSPYCVEIQGGSTSSMTPEQRQQLCSAFLHQYAAVIKAHPEQRDSIERLKAQFCPS